MPAAVLSTRADAGNGLLLVGLDVGPELADAYARPGQYIEVKTARGSGYFVLAGTPTRSRWELLVRNSGEAADVLHAMALGEALDVSPPLGHGFPIEEARERELVVAVVGSALAVARPIMEVRIDEGRAASTHLYLGVRAVRDVPLLTEVETWSRAGVRVVLCLSRSEIAHDDELLGATKRESGYVQRVLERAFTRRELAGRALVVAAGPEPMLAELRAFGLAHALEVLTNV